MLWSYLLHLAEEERLKKQLIVSRRLLRHRSDPMELPHNNFIDHFRLSKSQFLRLCRELIPLLPNRRRSAVRPDLKILAALTFFANGAYQKGVGAYYHLGLSQTTVHDCMWEVTEVLNSAEVIRKFVKFPRTQEEREMIARRFMEIFQFPGIVGIMDGTHVAIIRPQFDEEAYFNRKLYHSLNVLIVCDADLRILHIDASFGGASHDSHVWNQSPLLSYMQQLHEQGEVCWLLGDSGYAQRPWVMTPILDAAPNSPEEFYTARHVSTRNVVERCIGVLKNRFRCLLSHRVLHYSPLKAGKIVNSCAVLHNLINDSSVIINERDTERQIHVPFQGQQNDNQRQAVVDRLWSSRRH